MKGLLRWEAREVGRDVAPVSDLVEGERKERGSGRLKSSQFWLYFKCGKPRSQLPVGMGPQGGAALRWLTDLCRSGRGRRGTLAGSGQA